MKNPEQWWGCRGSMPPSKGPNLRDTAQVLVLSLLCRAICFLTSFISISNHASHQREQVLSWFGGTGRFWENSRLQMPWIVVQYKSTNDQNGRKVSFDFALFLFKCSPIRIFKSRSLVIAVGLFIRHQKFWLKMCLFSKLSPICGLNNFPLLDFPLFSILRIQQKLRSLAISAYTLYGFSVNYLINFCNLKSRQCEKLGNSVFYIIFNMHICGS